jgi:hypothetical protein
MRLKNIDPGETAADYRFPSAYSLTKERES